MTAETTVKSLHGHKVGRDWMACCPAHKDRTLSLSQLQNSNHGKLLMRWRAGCDQYVVMSTLKSYGLWPAKIALVTRGLHNSPIAIHPSYLNRDGAGKARVMPQKMMLRPCRGGAVRFARPGAVLMIGVGAKTCLAAMQQTGQPAWAALSTSGLRTLDLPGGAHSVIVFADGDDWARRLPSTAHYAGNEDRRVHIARPPKGMDFNDVMPSQMLSQRGMRNE